MKKFLSTIAYLDVQKILIAAVLIGGVFYQFFFDDGVILTKEVEELRNQTKQEEQKKKETELSLAEEKRMKEAVGILTEKYQLISKKLPAQLSTFEINTAIETYARETQVKIKSTKPGTAEHQEIVEEVPLEISIEGKYQDILQFIYNVSVAERLTRLKTLTLVPSGGIDHAFFSNSLKLDGVIVGYKLAPEKDEPKKEGAQ